MIGASDADVASITTVDESYGTEIVMGDQVLMIVTDDDARQLHVTRALLATYYARQIRNTLNQVRHEHSNEVSAESRGLRFGHVGGLHPDRLASAGGIPAAVAMAARFQDSAS